MTDPNGAIVPVTCQCGTKFDVPVGGLDLETLAFSCPNCGIADKFTNDQVAQIVEQHRLLAGAARQFAVDELNKVVKGFNRRNKRGK